LKSQVKGAIVSVQTSVQVPAPAGEVWMRTLATPRSELAVAASATVPRRTAPGSVSETETELKSVAAAKVLPVELVAAVKSAPEPVTPAPATTAISPRTTSARFTPPPSRSWRPRRRGGARGR
jgi:hypothetical protein